MPRVSRVSLDESSGAVFGRVLDEVGRGGARSAAEDEFSSFPAHPLASAIYSLDVSQATTTGGESHWDAALAWIEEQDETNLASEPEPEPLRVENDTPEAILAELGLTENLSHDELNRRRRLYMWRNHPDRRGEAQRESATRRVAIANMLVDRAQSRLAGARRS